MPNPEEERPARLGRIPYFPDAGKLWRFDGFGGVRQHTDGAAHTYLQVLLSPVADPRKNRFGGAGAVDYGEQHVSWVDSTLLPALGMRPGSIWKAGRWIENPPVRESDSHVFEGVRIAEDTTAEVLGRSLFKKWTFRLKQAYKTRFVLVRNGSGITLAIPAMELIRFYYAHSSTLARLLFEDVFVGVSKEEIPGVARVESAGRKPPASASRGAEGHRHLHVSLRKELLQNDAFVLARILRSDAAMKGAQKVYTTIAARYNRQPEGRGAIDTRQGRICFPSARFPFRGKTTLTVRGAPLECRDGQERFLVMRLEACTYPYPWDMLWVSHDASPGAERDLEKVVNYPPRASEKALS